MDVQSSGATCSYRIVSYNRQIGQCSYDSVVEVEEFVAVWSDN